MSAQVYGSLNHSFETGLNVSEPWPYDVIVNQFGLMLGDVDRGVRSRDLETEKPDDLRAVVPSDYSYGALNPVFGAIVSYGPMPLGLGQRFGKGLNDPRYRYALGANLSCGVWQKGPDLSDLLPAGRDTAPVNRFFTLGANFCWTNGRYVFKMDAAGVVTRCWDFGAGNACTDAIVFWYNGGAQAYAYFAMGDGVKIWRTADAVAFDQHASLEARAWVEQGQNIWRAHDRNRLSLCDVNADPWTAANWSAPNTFYIGDRNHTITRLALQANLVVVFKTDQPYVFDTVNGQRPLYRHLRFAPDPSGGEAMGHWLNDVYVTYQKGGYRIDGDLVVEQIGPEELAENDSPVKGRLTCYYGHETFYLFGGLYDDDTGTSHLVQFGGWTEGADGQWQRVDAWHGSLIVGQAKRMTAMGSTANNAPAGHRRLYLGYADGTLQSFVLPCVPNPAGCSAYRYSVLDGEIHLPTFTGKFESNIKPLRSAIAAGLFLDADNYARLEYKLSPSATLWTSLPGTFNALPNKQVEFPPGTTTVLADFKVVLTSNANTRSPLVRGIGVVHDLHTDLRQVMTLPVLCADGLVDREGGPLPYGADGIRDILRAAHDTPAGVEVTFPDESTRVVKIVGWRGVLAWDRRIETWRAALLLHLNEVSSVQRTGQYFRLENLTYGDMEAYSYAELEVI